MYISKPEYLNCSDNVVGGFILLLTGALMRDFPKCTVDRDDVSSILDALHVLRPDVPEVDALDAMLCAVNGRYDDAAHIFRQVIERAPQFASARALLAFSLAAKGDQQWRQYANELVNDPESGDANRLARVLIARSDLLDAHRASLKGARFAMPESVQSLMDDYPLAASTSGIDAPPEASEQPSHYAQGLGFLRA